MGASGPRHQRHERAFIDKESCKWVTGEVLEPAPPDGHEAVHWLLLTSLPVTTLEQADQEEKG